MQSYVVPTVYGKNAYDSSILMARVLKRAAHGLVRFDSSAFLINTHLRSTYRCKEKYTDVSIYMHWDNEPRHDRLKLVNFDIVGLGFRVWTLGGFKIGSEEN